MLSFQVQVNYCQSVGRPVSLCPLFTCVDPYGTGWRQALHFGLGDTITSVPPRYLKSNSSNFENFQFIHATVWSVDSLKNHEHCCHHVIF